MALGTGLLLIADLEGLRDVTDEFLDGMEVHLKGDEHYQ